MKKSYIIYLPDKHKYVYEDIWHEEYFTIFNTEEECFEFIKKEELYNVIYEIKTIWTLI